MVGRAVLVRCPPHGGACYVGARLPRWLCVVWWCWAWVVVVCAACRPALFGSGWWCFSRRHERLVLLVQRRLRRLTVGVFGWLWSAVGLRLWLCCLAPLFGEVAKFRTPTENQEHKSRDDDKVERCLPQNT